MSLWRWTGINWMDVSWHSLAVKGTAVICGSGSGLEEYAKQKKKAFHICVNSAHKLIEPNIWIGLDEPSVFGMDLLQKPCRKVFRGGMQEKKIGEVSIKDQMETYFLDLTPLPLENILLDRGPKIPFVWRKNSFLPAIQMAIWMGFRRIGFAGINLGGVHFDEPKLTDEQSKRNELLWKEINSDLRVLSSAASAMGVEMFSLTRKSPINDYLKVELNSEM